MNELYEPLLERDLDAIPEAARRYAAEQSADALWVALTRFAVLAYAPSMHGRRAVLACRAVHALRHELAEQWLDMLIECARYASTARPPWSEPPILDALDTTGWPALDTIHARGDALLLLDAVRALLPELGEKGRPALQRMVMAELPGNARSPHLDSQGSPDSVETIFWSVADAPELRSAVGRPLAPYSLARDFAQTLLAHFYARRLPVEEADALLAAVHHNLAYGESFADFA